MAGETVIDVIRHVLTSQDTSVGKPPVANVAVVLTVLAAAGGMASQQAAFVLARERGQLEDGDLIRIPSRDGRDYFSGNLLNMFVWESQGSLLSIGLGAFASLGRERVTAEVEKAFADNARRIGTPEFGLLQGRAGILLGGDPPVEWLRIFWRNIADVLQMYELAVTQWPMALGHAIRNAVEQTTDYDDPMIKLDIVLGCAIPMSKLDPVRVGLPSPLASFTFD